MNFKKRIFSIGLFFVIFLVIAFVLVKIFSGSILAYVEESDSLQTVKTGLLTSVSNLIKAKDLTLKGEYEESMKLVKETKTVLDKTKKDVFALDWIYSRLIPFSPFHTVLLLIDSLEEGADSIQYLDNAVWTVVAEQNLGSALVSLENLSLSIDRIESNLNFINPLFITQAQATKIFELKKILQKTKSYRGFFTENLDALYKLSGMHGAKSYAIVLQNTSEARATGGFIGSVALVTIQKGKIINFDIQDTQYLDFLNGDYYPAPPYYHYITRIDLKEANFIPDVRVSGEQIKFFLEKKGGPLVDGVLFLDDKILPFLLDLVSGVKIANIDEEITSKNYFDLIEFNLEERNVLQETRVKNPKEDFFAIVKAILSKVAKLKPSAENILDMRDFISKKHIQAYSPDSQIDEMIMNLGFIGYFPEVQEKEDFLAIIHTTFFNKSNRFLDNDIIHTSLVSKDGRIIDRLKIKRHHAFESGYFDNLFLKDKESFNLDQKNLLYDILGRGDNLDLIRIYVPKGSTIEKSIGIEQDSISVGEELGRTFFAFPLEIKASQSKEIIIDYILPFTIDNASSYSLYVFTQAGEEGTSFKKELYMEDESTPGNPVNTIDLNLSSDILLEANISNNSLWTHKDLPTNQLKIKSPSRLRMKIEQEYMPMPLQ